MRQLPPHEHGVTALNIAVDGQTISMDLNSPGADIVGFENQPVTEAEKTAVAKAKDTLARPLDLFVMAAGARCTVVSATADETFLGGQESRAPAGQSPNDLIDRYVQQSGHSDFTAAYTLKCQHPEAITGIDFRYFDVFPSADVVHLQAIGPRGPQVYDVARQQPHFALPNGL